MAYMWKTGYQKVAADVAGKEFERIEKKRGLTAAAVVDESRAEDAPLHRAFEWDDAVAGEEWRKQQARVMMGNLLIRIEDKPDAPVVRAIVKLEESECYESITTVLRVDDKRTAYIRQAMNELISYRQRYENITAFADLFAAADKVIAKKDEIIEMKGVM